MAVSPVSTVDSGMSSQSLTSNERILLAQLIQERMQRERAEALRLAAETQRVRAEARLRCAETEISALKQKIKIYEQAAAEVLLRCNSNEGTLLVIRRTFIGSHSGSFASTEKEVTQRLMERTALFSGCPM